MPARPQRKKALSLLAEAAQVDDWRVHKEILDTWIQVCREPDHKHWPAAVKEYNRYMLGVPVQEHEHTLAAPMSAWVDPQLAQAMGIKMIDVEYQGEDGESHIKRIVAGTLEEEDGPGL